MNLWAGGNVLWFVTVAAVVTIDVIALIVVPRGRKPTAAMAWLLLILALPFVGIVLYALIGSVKLPEKRRQEQSHINGVIRRRAAASGLEVDRSPWPAWFDQVTRQNEALTSLPPVEGNRLTLIGDYGGSIAAMTAAVETATRFVHVEFFIVSYDTTTKALFEAMAGAVRRGVTVRLLADQFSSRRVAGSKETFAELDRIGVRWAWMLPSTPLRGPYLRPDLRNHRKLVVVDGQVAFVGSQNLIDRTYNSPKNLARGLKWQELVARVEGPIVAEVDAVFFSDWLIETGEDLEAEHVAASDLVLHGSRDTVVCQIVPSGPSFDTEPNLRLFLALINGATERVILTSPYFVPDEPMIYAITSACHRGLDVQLFVSEIGDQGLVFHAQRSYYAPLLEAGVRIFRYPAPFILHAKHCSIDDDVAFIGSSNMDIRSFSLNSEISMLVRGTSFVRDMRAVEEAYRQASRELTLAEWKREPAKATFLDGLARLTSALN